MLKARQKRNLDILVLDRGNFNASNLVGDVGGADNSNGADEVKDVYTKGGLRSILGVTNDDEDSDDEGDNPLDESQGNSSNKDTFLDSDNVEKAMISLEDDDDVNALRGAQKEADEELKEFDETVEYKKDSDDDDEREGKGENRKKDKLGHSQSVVKEDDENDGDKEMEKEFAAWQSQVGMDAAAIEASLTPVERYGLRFKEDVDPFYSVYAIMEYRRKLEAEAEKEKEIDIDEIERQKALEEWKAIEDGEILATKTRPEYLIRQRSLYRREKARIRGKRKRRKLTGEDWDLRVDGKSQMPFWYNIDTGEARWDKPDVILEMEGYNLAHEKKWMALPSKPLIHVMEFLLPYPDRTTCSNVCKQWRKAANDPSFIRHVYPVEVGAYSLDIDKLGYNHFRSIDEAVGCALPGDTIGTQFRYVIFYLLLTILIILSFLQNLATDTIGKTPILLWINHLDSSVMRIIPLTLLLRWEGQLCGQV